MPKSVNEVFRDFERYTGDGKPGAPVGRPLPIGDPSSGVHNPSKADVREALGGVFDAAGTAIDAAAMAREYAASATGTPQFSTRALAQAATVPAYAQWIIVAGLIYRRDPAGTALVTSGGATWSHVPTAGGVDCRQFGVDPAHADNRAQLQLCIDTVIAAGGGVILIPEGQIRIGGELNCYRPNSPRVDLTLQGSSLNNSWLLADFFGADKALIKSVDPLGVTRSSPLILRNLRLGNVTSTGGVNPVFLDVAGWGNSHLDNVLFANSNNTHLRAGSIQNLRSIGAESWYGGYAYPVRSAEGITFAVTGGNTVTASAPFFRSNDKYLTLMPPGSPSERRRYRIASFISNTRVTLVTEGYRIQDGTGRVGYLDCPRVSMDAGDNLVYGLDGEAIFAPRDVGRTILIPKARSGYPTATDPRILRGRIIEYVAPNAVRIGDDWGDPINADRSVSAVPVGCPTLDLYQPRKPGTALGSLQSDFQAIQLHVEHFRGVGIFAETTDTWYLSGKIHGETNPTPTEYSLAAIWGNNVGGEWSGGLDSTCASGGAMTYFSDQSKVFRFLDLWARNAINERIVEVDVMSDASGYVIVDGLDAQNYSGDPTGLLIDPNTPYKALLLAFVNQSGDSQPSEYRFGHGSFIDHRYLRVQPGRLVLGQTVDAGSLPNMAIGVSATGALIYRGPDGVLRTITTTTA